MLQELSPFLHHACKRSGLNPHVVEVRKVQAPRVRARVDSCSFSCRLDNIDEDHSYTTPTRVLASTRPGVEARKVQASGVQEYVGPWSGSWSGMVFGVAYLGELLSALWHPSTLCLWSVNKVYTCTWSCSLALLHSCTPAVLQSCTLALLHSPSFASNLSRVSAARKQDRNIVCKGKVFYS